MGRRKTKNPFADIDSTNTYSRHESFAPMYHSQLVSPAYMELSDSAKALLTVCKDVRRFSLSRTQGGSYPQAPKDDPLCFYMNRALVKQYGSGWTSPNKFMRAMRELVLHGFVEVVEIGSTTRTKNIYRFSTKWQKLKPDERITPEGADKIFLTPKRRPRGHT